MDSSEFSSLDILDTQETVSALFIHYYRKNFKLDKCKYPKILQVLSEIEQFITLEYIRSNTLYSILADLGKDTNHISLYLCKNEILDWHMKSKLDILDDEFKDLRIYDLLSNPSYTIEIPNILEFQRKLKNVCIKNNYVYNQVFIDDLVYKNGIGGRCNIDFNYFIDFSQQRSILGEIVPDPFD